MQNTKNYQRGGLISILVALIAFTAYFSPELRSLLRRDAELSSMIVSYDPLIIYIENFSSPWEMSHMKDIAQTRFKPSNITDHDTGESVASTDRRSSTAVLPRSDVVVQAIIERAAKFQGLTSTDHVENLQATRYVSGGEYGPHYDTLYRSVRESNETGRDMEREKPDRATTIFAILDADCGRKCGTQFPRIIVDWQAEDNRWCDIVDCADSRLTIQPKVGNAVFWRNMNDDGFVHKRTLHAGLPLDYGTKLGLNIWTRNEKHIYADGV